MKRVAEQALDRALDDAGHLVLTYQPIHFVEGGGIYGAEALLRQRRATGTLREASIITETAEEIGGAHLFCLDEMLVKKAYSDAAKWHEAGFQEVRLNVNLSPREFQEGRVIERLTALISASRIATDKVNLEITETSYIESPKETMEVLNAIVQSGVGLWLDDFGTGHSSLEHIQRFPLHGVKLPATFVKWLPSDRRCAAIARAVITLAHELEMQVIAEGVEHPAQLAFLKDLGCEYVQGFLFSKPMTTEAFQAMLAGQHPAGTIAGPA